MDSISNGTGLGGKRAPLASERFGDRFQLAVAPDRALDAFSHPFAYAAQGM